MKAKIDKKNVHEIFELSMVQKGMLFHYLKDVTSNVYNVQLVFDIEGELDKDILLAAIEKVQGTNDVLRSVFSWDKVSKPLQIILKECKVDFTYDDISNHNEDNAVAFIQQWIFKDQQQRFDLETLPLRFRLLRTFGRSFVLIITHHHILYDGWSTGIFLKELFFCYSMLNKQLQPVFPDKPVYTDIYHQLKKKSRVKDSDVYWKNYLGGYEMNNLFSPGHTRNTLEDGVGEFHLDMTMMPIRAFGSKYKVTHSAVIYAAFGLLLQRYADATDIVFGTTVSNRDPEIPGTGEIMGNFINTLPLRVNGPADSSLLDMVFRIHHELVNRNDYNDTSYAEIKELLRLKPDENLFDAIVVIENYPLNETAISNNNDFSIRLRSSYEHTDAPLLVTVFLRDKLEVKFSYKQRLFDEKYMQSLARHFMAVINNIVADPLQQAGSMNLLSEEEKTSLLNDFNNADAWYPREETVISLFEKQVRNTPGNIAIRCDGKRYTYKEINEQANQLAACLREDHGIIANDIVGVLMTKSERLIITILSILKAGASYLPIDLNNPKERIEYMVEASGMKVLITSEQVPGNKEYDGLTVLEYEALEAYARGSSKEDAVIPVLPEGIFYTIYTSGSTGLPKGVGIKNTAFVNLVNWYGKALQATGQDNFLLIAPISFDLAQKNIFTPLLNGACITLSEKIQLNYAEMARVIEAEEITVINCAPAAFYPLLNEHINHAYRCLSKVRKIVLGGENINMKAFKGWLHSGHFHAAIINSYGPTECTDVVTYYELKDPVVNDYTIIPIGKPVDNTKIYLLDRNNNLQPVGARGEVCIGGIGVSGGYHNNLELTQQKFFPDHFTGNGFLYRTGDAGKWLPDGNIEFLGRIDNQVKVRGFRIELGEIESLLNSHESIRQSLVTVKEMYQEKYLVAYYVADMAIGPSSLKSFLTKKLPDYMIPALYVHLKSMPMTPNGKLDRRSLPEPEFKPANDFVAAAGDVEKKLLAIWEEVLGHGNIGTTTNFFDIGGDSLKLITVSSRIKMAFDKEVLVTDLFNYPTIAGLAAFINGKEPLTEKIQEETRDLVAQLGNRDNQSVSSSGDIAIIGLACRFPGADNANAFWDNLQAGVESIRRGETVKPDPSWVQAKGHLAGYEFFDAAFFNYSPADAGLMDPQIRIFHESVWAALENAGYSPTSYAGKIGLYAGASPNPYYNLDVHKHPGEEMLGEWASLSYADKDFLCARVSYKLNLKGPGVNINTACSTSLVAVDTARNELLANKCDMAVAGGVSVTLHDEEGYTYHKGMVMSPDGRCRAFDKEAGGTVGGNGVGVVVLKKLTKALQDGDHIYAVIKGSATNNDGSQKVGFAAPSIEGQSNVIDMALRDAGIPAENISYVETHGSGTILGDPIEVAALKKAFNTNNRKYCAIGSVKTNIGHLDAAAGVASLIKTAMALKHKQLPPSLHYKNPNPNIDFDNSPFYVNASSKSWEKTSFPRTAGVSSFGIGGTNAHVVMQEAPEQEASSESRSYQLLLLSARTMSSLSGNITELVNYFKTGDGSRLSDIAYTLQVGRESFAYRKMVVCKDKEEAIEALISPGFGKKIKPLLDKQPPKVVFMFPGQGSQYMNMCHDLYEKEAYFRDEVDHCLDIVERLSGKGLSKVMFAGNGPDAAMQLDNTQFAQPALFIIEYALARLLMKWGINPDFMIGHSFGEYVAACISGVFSLEDALLVVIKRGELMQQTPKGISLGVAISEELLKPFVAQYAGLALATVNSDELCVVSGDEAPVTAFRLEMQKNGYSSEIVSHSHAFHSHLMDGILTAFGECLKQVTLHPPNIPFMSNLSGDVASDEQVSTIQYWTNHLRQTVRFSDGIKALMKHEQLVFVEVGPGIELSTFVRSIRTRSKGHKVVNTVRHPNTEGDDQYHLLTALGKLWSNGITPAWDSFYERERRRRVPLPTYAFDKVQYPVKSASQMRAPKQKEQGLVRINDISKWFYVPVWKMAPWLPGHAGDNGLCTLILGDEHGICLALADTFRRCQIRVVTVQKGMYFAQESATHYRVDPHSEEDFYQLFGALTANGLFPDRVIHAWGIERRNEEQFQQEIFRQDCGLYLFSLLNMIKAARQQDKLHIKQITLVSSDLQSVTGTEDVCLAKSLPLGLLKVISQEYPLISTNHIDISLPEKPDQYFVNRLYTEIMQEGTGRNVALRNQKRWIQDFEAIESRDDRHNRSVGFRENGVYLITGGLGNLGFAIAQYLLKNYRAKMILVGRTQLPPEQRWDDYAGEPGGQQGVQEKIQRLKVLREKGEVVYFSCDVSVLSQLELAIQEGERRLGRINGVLYAAGLVEGRSISPISELKKEDFESQFLPKVTGLQVLKNVLTERPIDFCMVISSLSPILGGLEFGAYSAANTYIDHFINFHRERSALENWICVNIDGLNLHGGTGEGINSREIDETFERILSLMSLQQVIISVADLNKRMAQWVRRDNGHTKIPDIPVLEMLPVNGLNSEPATAVQSKLVQLWKNFFGIADIEIDDDFLELGGDSLKALTMIGRIHREFNVELPVRELFNSSTIRKLADRINSMKNGAGADKENTGDSYTPITKAAMKDTYPLSSVQRRLYFLYEFDRQSTAYNQALTLKLEGYVDKLRLEDAFRKLIQRHESLRTSFEVVGEEPRQRVMSQFDFNLEVYQAGEQPEQVLETFIQPFDLGKAPLIRVGLISISGQEHVLVVDMHHIITDAVSKSVLIKDFMALYDNRELPASSLQYKDYVTWQMDQKQREEMARRKGFWINEFSSELPVAELPADYPRPSVKSYEGNALGFELSAEETKALTSIGDKEGATMFMVLLSVYSILLAKLANQEDIVVGTFAAGRQHPDLEKIIGMFVNTIALRIYPEKELRFEAFLSEVKSKTLLAFDNQSYPYEELIDDLKLERDASRNPLFEALFSYRNYEQTVLEIPGLTIRDYQYAHVVVNFDITLKAIRKGEKILLEFEYCTRLFKQETIRRFIGYFKRIISAIIEAPHVKIGEISILSPEERGQLLVGFNDTRAKHPGNQTLVSLFEEQVLRTPDKTAVVYEGRQLTYRELNERSNRFAACLRQEYYIGPGDLVAIMVDRSEQLMIGLLGILKAGGAYIPIDPAYPEKRVLYILEDSGASILLTSEKLGKGLDYRGLTLYLEKEDDSWPQSINMPRINNPEDLCYLIYTSGSTGKPKGVMISHHSVVNFFKGMDRRLGAGPKDCLLSVTSTSFDISVLELFWTLCNGIQVVIHPSDISLETLDRYIPEEGSGMDFSLFFFSSYDYNQEDKYHLLLESVKYADREGFKAVWTPERHFHEFGGLYPNPSVISAALAMITEQIELRSGSIVSPLHDTIRIAEEWAVVDNLSNGRIGLSFASGWRPEDFVLSGASFKDRQKTMYAQIDEVRKIWKGESIKRMNGLGKEVALQVFPSPIQEELPVWVTSGGSEETFISAGAIGANLLTHLLGQDVEELGRKIRLYRESLKKNGFGERSGKVTIMLHTYVGEDINEVEKTVEKPFIEYLKSSIGLSKVLNEESGLKEEDIPEKDKEVMIYNAFRRYYKTGSLIGTRNSCYEMVSKLKKIGVDEIACLIDFGIEHSQVLNNLRILNDLKKSVNAGHIVQTPITMLQSTPSFIKLARESAGSQKFLKSLRTLLLGGEPVPVTLVRKLKNDLNAAIHNMYGPTETTIWSCTHEFEAYPEKVCVGKPILNTQIYILDKSLQLVPIGVTGDLYIGGEGLAIGYWKRPELTADKFIANPFIEGDKIYQTGDVARWLPDGNIELIGRDDQQVKIRGYRIELGEIESALLGYEHVKEAVVVAKDEKEGNGKYLVAYLIGEMSLDLSLLREYLSKNLPHYMIPGHFVKLVEFPLTPNGKIDRKALPDPEIGAKVEYIGPSNETEERLVEIWSEILKMDKERISVQTSFFELGGHSLNALILVRRIAKEFNVEILLQKIFVIQTIERIADIIDNTRWIVKEVQKDVALGEGIIIE